jgi:hypothetical protein
VGRAILKSCFSQQKHGFNPKGIDFGLVVEKVAVKKALHQAIRYAPTSCSPIPPLSHLSPEAAAVPRDSPRPMNKNTMKSVKRGEILMLKQYIIKGFYYRSEYYRLYVNVL